MNEVQETNLLLDQIEKVNSILSGRQKEFHNIILKHSKVAHCLPINEVLTPEEIEQIKMVVNPKRNECFKNAQNVARYIPGTVYVEGMYSVANVIGVEHAFNRKGDKYFDVTAEIALGKDVRQESYLSIMEVTNSYDILSAQVDLECYTALIPYFGGKKYLV